MKYKNKKVKFGMTRAGAMKLVKNKNAPPGLKKYYKKKFKL